MSVKRRLGGLPTSAERLTSRMGAIVTRRGAPIAYTIAEQNWHQNRTSELAPEGASPGVPPPLHGQSCSNRYSPSHCREPKGAQQQNLRGTLRGRPRPARLGGQIDAGRPGAVEGIVRLCEERRGIPVWRAHLSTQLGVLTCCRRSHTHAQTATECKRAHEPCGIGGARGLHPRPARALLEERSSQTADRRREGEEAVRQARGGKGSRLAARQAAPGAHAALIYWLKVACGALSETLHISRRQKAWFLPAAQRRVPGALSETLYISHRQKAWFLPAAQRRVRGALGEIPHICRPYAGRQKTWFCRAAGCRRCWRRFDFARLAP